jgi:hypothetical protein
VTGTLAYVFVGVALLCIVAGVAAVGRTRRRLRDADEEYGGSGGGGATYAEEAAAVAAAEAALAVTSAENDEVDGSPPA